MINFNLFNGKELHPSPYYQDQSRTTGDALVEIVKIFSHDVYYTAWVEDIQLDGKVVKVGCYGMAGEKWIHVYEGPHDEIMPLADVCIWFYKATGHASDEFKATMLREEQPVASPA